jgi:hypothetical protein
VSKVRLCYSLYPLEPRTPSSLYPSRGLVSLGCSSSIKGSTHCSLDSIPFGILSREKCYNSVSVRLLTHSHQLIYPGDS